MPVCAPKAVETLARIERWSVMSVEVVLSMPTPPYSSGMSTEVNPSSAALRSSDFRTPGSLASMAAVKGRISSRANRAAVSAICRCSSFRSSGVKTSAGVRDLSRKLPPAAATIGEAVSVDIRKSLQLPQQYDTGTEKGKCAWSSRGCTPRANFEYGTFDLLKIGDHLEEVSGLRVPGWAEHPHKALRGPAKRGPEFWKANRAVNVFAQNDLPRLDISRGHAGQSLTKEGAAKIWILFKVRFYRLAKSSCRCHHASP